MGRVPRIVGVIHLPPLPGTARGGSGRSMAQVLEAARRDASAYAEGGVDGLIVENFGDVPFAKDRVGAEIVAAMTLAVAAVREETHLPVGVNVLRNDVLSAVAVAAIAGGQFVRANVYVGAAVTDQGIIEGRAEDVQALIRRLDAPVAVWADVDVKHAAPLASRPLGDVAQDAVERGLAG
ncbi:MAG: phosphorybosylanthranilate isomerase, partial [Chloroflexota bacterium]